MRRIAWIVLFTLAIWPVFAQKVQVAAAANLRDVLTEIKTAYQKTRPNAQINLTFGSSGTLVQQIMNGASFDLFMSADNQYPLKLKEKGLTVGNMKTYAYGQLALYSSTLNVRQLGMNALQDNRVKKIALANPQTAPYGERARNIIQSHPDAKTLMAKLVVAENISQAAQFAFSGNAELGFIALSLALAPEMKNKGFYYEIPQAMYPPIEQACILIKKAALNTEASTFQSFVLSETVKPIWEKFGYALPKK